MVRKSAFISRVPHPPVSRFPAPSAPTGLRKGISRQSRSSILWDQSHRHYCFQGTSRSYYSLVDEVHLRSFRWFHSDPSSRRPSPPSHRGIILASLVRRQRDPTIHRCSRDFHGPEIAITAKGVENFCDVVGNQHSRPRRTRECRHRWISASSPDGGCVYVAPGTGVSHPDQTF